MSVISLRFLAFTALVFLLYWLFPRRLRWLVLLAGSAVFILANTSPRWLACVFLAEVLLTWLAARVEEKSGDDLLKSRLTGATVFILVALMVLFKDLSFFVETFNHLARLFRSPARLETPWYPAPYGISYYTLILIGYLLDVRWGKIVPQQNPLRLLSFTGFFPQLPSGPFSRYEDTALALFEGTDFALRRVQFGLQRILWGLFKKLVIAERVAVLVAAIYDSDGAYPGVFVILGAFLYVTQIYTDFGGCMDIVIGVAELFGVTLAENFRRPFASVTLSEFWRRWHMTLGFWLKDYLLYPVLKSGWMARLRRRIKDRWGKKASREIPTYIGMLITWFCVGFWHGGTWKYVCSTGLFFFGMIAGGMVLEPYFDKLTKFLKINTDAWSWTVFCRVRTFCLLSLSISFGRWSNLSAGFRAWKTAFTVFNPWALVDGSLLQMGLDGKDLCVCALGLGLLTLVSSIQERHGSVRELVARQNLAFRWLVWLALLLTVLVFGCYGPGYQAADFIYMRF